LQERRPQVNPVGIAEHHGVLVPVAIVDTS
jgi:hypothetical protein